MKVGVKEVCRPHHLHTSDPSRETFPFTATHLYAAPPYVVIACRCRTGSIGNFLLISGWLMQHPASEVPRIFLLRTTVNKGNEEGPGRMVPALPRSCGATRLVAIQRGQVPARSGRCRRRTPNLPAGGTRRTLLLAQKPPAQNRGRLAPSRSRLLPHPSCRL
jgi:hypothetical protein